MEYIDDKYDNVCCRLYSTKMLRSSDETNCSRICELLTLNWALKKAGIVVLCGVYTKIGNKLLDLRLGMFKLFIVVWNLAFTAIVNPINEYNDN